VTVAAFRAAGVEPTQDAWLATRSPLIAEVTKTIAREHWSGALGHHRGLTSGMPPPDTRHRVLHIPWATVMASGPDMIASASSGDPVLRAMLQLEPLSAEMPERELIQAGIEIAQAATSSQIGYLHYLNDDEKTIELGTWSRATRGYCTAVYDRHYPIDAAGIWADPARLRTPCIHNDYAATPHKRGMPEGHSPLQRHLGVPVLDEGRVRLLIGVGNKETEYDEGDVAVVQLIAQRIWSLIGHRRAVEHHLDMERRFLRVQEIAAVCGLEYDVDEDRLRFDGMFASLFLTRGEDEVPATLGELLAFVVPADHERLREALAASEAGSRRVLQIGCRRAGGEGFPAELKIEFRPRDVGRGLIGVGILQDVSEQLAVEDLRRRADLDALTGLPNRNHLHRLFDQGSIERRGAHDHFAFFYVDLDDFKPVNDTHGHAHGDEVLRIVASRLRHAVRSDDLVVRLGGDEFAVIQAGVSDINAAAALADMMIACISEPIALAGQMIRVGASVGIAIRTNLSGGLAEVSAAADRALYRAKAAGGACWIVETGE
jgi:diguanylate cyclase (GGDEF)-like protein